MDVAELEEGADFVYEISADETVTEGVVTAVAATTNTEIQGMPPLYETVNADALNEIFADRHDGTVRTTGQVRFTYCECDVVVLSNGRIIVEADV